MDYAFDRFTAEIRTALIEQGRIPTEQVELVTPKPGIAADLAFPTFRLAHERDAPAPHVAQRLADTLRFAVGCGNVI
jgi:arginyl-tRNA synthetase